ncbi:hypothetical protein XNC1_2691 [Xenorhabdus nematophila ATCC 19061]|uniref:Uncharacterized protein n=1 Tax=Xenorhabdus nematophila (strain ATCC 19061 / DSM 3370 / CCUG 14189 / LMG 1036 / NCIMB 9965 / AN6) TaxID=406817 RepID=D3VIA5_XENNA|nr:hypothetical protein XNC1_2691 [Xenorhabdus nematophila ATCC 19061]CEF30704.1 hypothetical protein XNW1_2810011 [Xenorhabdus nematophila str. Websteri]CEK23582.1 hypothetical protein XNC2_2588 [Xenorhabdus nematophila AN6/1]
MAPAPEKNGLRLYKEYVIKHMGKRSKVLLINNSNEYWFVYFYVNRRIK